MTWPVEDTAPFILAIVTILLQPAFDLLWQGRYEEVYKADRNMLENGATWVSMMGAFFPSAALTLFATFLLVEANDDERAWLFLGGAILIIVTVVLYFIASKRSHPNYQPRLRIYYALQVWLIFLNVLGILTALFLE